MVALLNCCTGLCFFIKYDIACFDYSSCAFFLGIRTKCSNLMKRCEMRKLMHGIRFKYLGQLKVRGLYEQVLRLEPKWLAFFCRIITESLLGYFFVRLFCFFTLLYRRTFSSRIWPSLPDSSTGARRRRKPILAQLRLRPRRT